MIIDGNKYIWFELMQDTGATQYWNVVNKKYGDVLGLISWYHGWRQYVFRPAENTEYNATCLDTINDFIKRLNIEHRILQSVSSPLVGTKEKPLSME